MADSQDAQIVGCRWFYQKQDEQGKWCDRAQEELGEGAQIVTEEVEDGERRCFLKMLQVTSPTALIRNLNYLKYNLWKRGTKTFYRGQTALYLNAQREVSLCPTGLREESPSHPVVTYRLRAQEFLLRKVYPAAEEALDRAFRTDAEGSPYPRTWLENKKILEGLFQQYGLKTTWVDAVDNIWTALWFACHDFNRKESADAQGREEFEIERREAKKDAYAYIFLLGAKADVQRKPEATAKTQDVTQDSMFARSEYLDLRTAVPAYFVRPHIQHGVLVRCTAQERKEMNSLIKGIIRIPLEKALAWLGEGAFFDPTTMLPLKEQDEGFQCLLAAETHLFPKSDDALLALLKDLPKVSKSAKAASPEGTSRLRRFPRNKLPDLPFHFPTYSPAEKST